MPGTLQRLLTAHPINQFKKNPRFYFQYDGFWLLACGAVLAALLGAGYRPYLGGPQAWFAAAFPPLLFAFIWAHLLIHNCTHGNLPRAINRVAGELLGLVIITRFASWDITHMRHHKYPDDRSKDPHPNLPSFWRTVRHTIVNVEQQLFQQYFDTWGDTPFNRAKEQRRAYLSYGTNVVLLACWALLLGPAFFLCVFVPANLLAGLFVLHFNWSTHNGEAATELSQMRPTNLTRRYYRIANRFFCGIYAHQTHHELPHLFNPARHTSFVKAAAEREAWEQAA